MAETGVEFAIPGFLLITPGFLYVSPNRISIYATPNLRGWITRFVEPGRPLLFLGCCAGENYNGDCLVLKFLIGEEIVYTSVRISDELTRMTDEQET